MSFQLSALPLSQWYYCHINARLVLSNLPLLSKQLWALTLDNFAVLTLEPSFHGPFFNPLCNNIFPVSIHCNDMKNSRLRRPAEKKKEEGKRKLHIISYFCELLFAGAPPLPSGDLTKIQAKWVGFGDDGIFLAISSIQKIPSTGDGIWCNA